MGPLIAALSTPVQVKSKRQKVASRFHVVERSCIQQEGSVPWRKQAVISSSDGQQASNGSSNNKHIKSIALEGLCRRRASQSKLAFRLLVGQLAFVAMAQMIETAKVSHQGQLMSSVPSDDIRLLNGPIQIITSVGSVMIDLKADTMKDLTPTPESAFVGQPRTARKLRTKRASFLGILQSKRQAAVSKDQSQSGPEKQGKTSSLSSHPTPVARLSSNSERRQDRASMTGVARSNQVIVDQERGDDHQLAHKDVDSQENSYEFSPVPFESLRNKAEADKPAFKSVLVSESSNALQSNGFFKLTPRFSSNESRWLPMTPSRLQTRFVGPDQQPAKSHPRADKKPDRDVVSADTAIPRSNKVQLDERGDHYMQYRAPREHRYNNHHVSYQSNHLRRPRLHNGQPHRISTSKMYKRVLLCDKTLVSLDYVRNLELEPRPWGSFDELEDFDENLIDLDNKLNPPDGDATFYYNISALDDLVDRIDISNSAPRFERRSYLTDRDPLVRCDMWDLEKGAKNRKPPREILRAAVKADFDTVRDAINRCRQLSEKTMPPDDEYRDGLEVMSAEDLLSIFSIKRGLLPGTKWCGLGDQAESYNDLGNKHRIDLCCRAHDHCPIRLRPFRNEYGVLNIALYTKSHCDCDADFYRCLRDVRSRTADMLGNLYFNVMKLQCLREERMKICREMRPIALGFERCVKYEESPGRKVFRFTTPPVAY